MVNPWKHPLLESLRINLCILLLLSMLEKISLFLMKGAVGGGGFDVQYSSGKCLPYVVIQNNTGEFNDGSGDANYLDNSNCQWLLQPTNTSFSVQVTFDGNTAESSDKIQVYDGPTSKFPLLATLSGTFGTKIVKGTTESMLVTWFSDSSKNSQGWSARFSSF